jgi:hypothetical protein
MFGNVINDSEQPKDASPSDRTTKGTSKWHFTTLEDKLPHP